MLQVDFVATVSAKPVFSSGFVKKSAKMWKCLKLTLLAISEQGAQPFYIAYWNKDITDEYKELCPGDVVRGTGTIDVKAFGGARNAKASIYVVPQGELEIISKVKRKTDEV